MNPWISILTKPRQTIRQIVDTHPTHLVIVLAIAGGIADTLIALTGSVQLPLGVTAAIGIGAGATLGLLGLYFLGWLYRWVGSWFGGRATHVEVRAAIAWLKVVSLYLFAIWAVLMLVSGGQMGTIPSLIHAVVSVIGGIWIIVLACHTLGEVHRFSAWKGFGTMCIAQVMITVPVIILAMLAAIAIPYALRDRLVGNETMTLANLHILVNTAGTYQSANNSYPDSWLDDIYGDGDPKLLPQGFDVDLQQERQPIGGYLYRYTPQPDGCAEPDCAGFIITADPEEAVSKTSRSFFVDASGSIRHCEGGSGADASDPPVHEAPVGC